MSKLPHMMILPPLKINHLHSIFLFNSLKYEGIPKVARSKARQAKKKIKFLEGDMRSTKAGSFDAAITIFNAVGHLTKRDFEKAMKNIHANLNDRGVYIFDIFNLSYLLKDDNITKLTIDWQKKSGNTTVREIQYSTINKDGVLASYDIYHEQVGSRKPKVATSFQTLQIYSAHQLKDMLQKSGFKMIRKCNVDGSRFSETKSERILVVAKKL